MGCSRRFGPNVDRHVHVRNTSRELLHYGVACLLTFITDAWTGPPSALEHVPYPLPQDAPVLQQLAVDALAADGEVRDRMRA